MQWLHANAEAISAVANVGMVLIWLLYLQLFYRVFRQDRRTRVLMQPAGGTRVDSECRLVNMSATHVDVANVLLAVGFEGQPEQSVHSLEYLATRVASLNGVETMPRHGPIAPGGWRVMGTFDDLLKAAEEAAPSEQGGQGRTIRSIELRAVFFTRMYDEPLAAYRRFSVLHQGRFRQIQPETCHTHQLIRWPGRRTARRWYLQSEEADPSQAPVGLQRK